MMPTPPQATCILVIEDDLDTREFYEHLLMSEGFAVLSASSGQQALAQTAVQVVHGIVLDRRLPDIDGVDLCRLLRQQVASDMPIIFVTADRDPALEAMARTAGITDFLLKPFQPTDIIDRLHRLI
jgi:DNA-binding response OmpR family regulator